MLEFQQLALRQNEWTPSTKVFSETSFPVIFERFVLIRRRHSFVPAKKRKCSNSGNFFNPGLQRMRGFFGLDLPSRNVLKKELPQHQPSSAMEMNAYRHILKLTNLPPTEHTCYSTNFLPRHRISLSGTLHISDSTAQICRPQ